MKVLIVGRGGRAHALTWKLAKSPKVSAIYIAPGNAGTASEPKAQNINIDTTDIHKLLDFVKKEGIALAVVGPEAPLALGIVDEFKKHGIPIFGPTKAAAEIETSKSFCKEFLERHNIPCPKFEVFTDPEKAKAYVKKEGTPIVIKADGSAEGKGVVIANSQKVAETAIDRMFSGEIPGANGKVEIEEFVKGEEVSYLVMVDGENILPFSSVRDHKALQDGGKGPNTGGMGAYSPAPIITPDLDHKIMKDIIVPTVKGLKSENRHFQGFLYAGLMILPNGEPTVLEYNCRLGDPEAQVIMMRLDDDIFHLLRAAVEQRLGEIIAKWDPRPSVCVVMTSEGYPDKYPTGEKITGLPQVSVPEIKVFHAGTLNGENGDTGTAGGRVLCVTAIGENFTDAKSRVYDIVKNIKWDHQFYRTDIAQRAIEIAG